MAVRIVGRRPHLAVALALMAFVVVLAVQRPESLVDVTVRQPERARLTSLVDAEREQVERLRGVAADLRERLDAAATESAPPSAGRSEALDEARWMSGLLPAAGPGLVVELDDAREALGRLDPAEVTNLNDYIIHSQDVRAVANGLWAAGAEAVAVNGERLIPTSALLCVGNTLLVNGTVHSPPYRFEAIGDPEVLAPAFRSHSLVERFAADAERFELGFRVEPVEDLELPEYRGSTGIRHARPGA